MHNAGWRLLSTNGYSQLICALVAAGESSLVHDVRVEQNLLGEPGAMVTATGIALSPESLTELVTVLQAWLAQPLGGLALDRLDYSIELAANPHESLKLTLGRRDDVITTTGSAAASIELRRGSLRASVVFATDPTCLQLLADGVEHVLTTPLSGTS